MTITDRLQGRPIFQGFVVPYTVVVDAHGVPDFKVTNMDRWFECVEARTLRRLRRAPGLLGVVPRRRGMRG